MGEPPGQTRDATRVDRPRPEDAGGEPSALLELERFMPYRLSVVSSRISGSLAREYQARFGISIPEWRVMAVLGRFAPLSASEVAGRTRMDKVKVSRAVAAMERKGLLDRAIDPHDHRVTRLALSERGGSAYREIAALALGWERRLLGCLEPSALAGLEAALRCLSQRLDAFEAGTREGP
jgi:DNA-binding MarR family transcriptional regulator